MTPLIPGARLRMRSLLLHLNVEGLQTAEHALVSWDDSCHWDLLWWSDASHLVGCVSLDLPQPLLFLFTDASDSGWGATLGDYQLSGLWTQDISRFSINHRELLAILFAIWGFLHLLKGRLGVLVHGQHLGSSLPPQGRGYPLGYPQFHGSIHPSPLRTQRCSSAPQFLPGKLNVLADSLSRGSQVLGSEWTPCQEVYRDLFRRWPVTIDLSATSINHRLQVYFSSVLDPQALATDAVRQNWDGLQAYAFPPFGFIPNVLAKVRQSRNLEVTLVVPFWPMKPWFLDILELFVDVAYWFFFRCTRTCSASLISIIFIRTSPRIT